MIARSFLMLPPRHSPAAIARSSGVSGTAKSLRAFLGHNILDEAMRDGRQILDCRLRNPDDAEPVAQRRWQSGVVVRGQQERNKTEIHVRLHKRVGEPLRIFRFAHRQQSLGQRAVVPAVAGGLIDFVNVHDHIANACGTDRVEREARLSARPPSRRAAESIVAAARAIKSTSPAPIMHRKPAF